MNHGVLTLIFTVSIATASTTKDIFLLNPLVFPQNDNERKFCFILREILGGQLGSAILKDGNSLALHYVMFIPTIMGQGTVEQQAEWIQKAWNVDIVGTYAQVSVKFF